MPTHWALTLSSLRLLGVSREARVAQADALETDVAVTLFGGGPQNGPRGAQIMGVAMDLVDGSGAAIVSMDGGAPQVVRAGKSSSSSIKLVETRACSVVIEHNGTCQETLPPASAVAGVSPANRNMLAMSLPLAGAVAPLSTPAMPPAPLVANNPANTAIPGATLPVVPAQINMGGEPVSQGGGIVGPRHRAAAAACKGDTPQPNAD